jgi:hypothetical protein
MRIVSVGTLIVVASVILAAVAASVRGGSTPSDFSHLREPRLTRLPDQKMLVVETTGDPNVVGSAAFRRLFKAYFSLKGVLKGRSQPAPRARWVGFLASSPPPKAAWLGRYALPLPDGASVSSDLVSDGQPVSTQTWTYGDVAEVLHIGSYATEQPDIDRLHDFIKRQGYQIAGEHEEEYVRGPGMFFAGNPEKYLTIIRYRVLP